MRLLVFAVLGAWLAALGCGHRGGPLGLWKAARAPSNGPRELAGLVLDRGQQKVWGLDRDGIRCRAWSLARVVDAYFESEQGWWLAQRGATPHDPARLLWVEAGQVQARLAVPPVLELTAGAGPATCWALLQPNPGAERVVSWRPGEPAQVLIEVPGAERLIRGPAGAWAIHPGGMLWWIPGRAPQTAVAWALPAGVRLARSVGTELWIRLDSKGGPWCRVDPERGPEEARPIPWAPASIDLESMRRSPVARAWLEAHSIEPLYSLGDRTHPPTGSSRTQPQREPAGWALLAPEFVWELDAQGRPMRGQGGFSLLKASYWSRGSRPHGTRTPNPMGL